MQKGDLSSIPGCDKLFDDHVAVQRLGYSNCQEAYGDYVKKNLDTKKLYDTNRSLQDMCPITTKSDKYMKCLNDLYSKFNTNNNNLINFNNPYAISIGFGIIVGIILIGLLYNFLCMKKNNIKEREIDDKYILPSMSYSPKSPNHSKVKSIFQR